MKATFIKDVSDMFQGTAHLFHLDTRCETKILTKESNEDDYSEYHLETIWFDYIVISAVDLSKFIEKMQKAAKSNLRETLSMSVLAKSETFIFPAEESGRVISWQNLPGSFNGSMDIEAAKQAFEDHYSKVTV